MDQHYRTTSNLLDTLEIAFCVFDAQDRMVAPNPTFLRLFPEYADGAEHPRAWPHGEAGLFRHAGRWLQQRSTPLEGGGRARVCMPSRADALPPGERHAFDQSFIPTLLAAPGGGLIDANDALCGLLGYSREETLALGLADIVDPCAAEPAFDALASPGARQRDCQASHVTGREAAFRRKDGSVGFCQWFCAPVFDPTAGRHHIVGHLVDITRRKSEEQARERMVDALRNEAGQDELTGLANRRRLETELQALMHQSGSHGLLFIDLDGFKLVNDRAGHAYGDVVLRQVASLMRRTVRGSDVVGRLGGDEFVVLLRDCDAAHVAAVGANLVKVLGRSEFGLGDRLYRIGASIGARVFGNRPETMEAVLLDADGACYRAKKNGRNRVELHG